MARNHCLLRKGSQRNQADDWEKLLPFLVAGYFRRGGWVSIHVTPGQRDLRFIPVSRPLKITLKIQDLLHLPEVHLNLQKTLEISLIPSLFAVQYHQQVPYREPFCGQRDLNTPSGLVGPAGISLGNFIWFLYLQVALLQEMRNIWYPEHYDLRIPL